jgi:RNA polymerase sigma-70 factor (ECF subfamily)
MARPAPSPLVATQQQELGGLITKAIQTLSPEHRAVITLNLIEGFQYNEIAEKLGISIGTVMSRLFYARKKLQVQLKDLYDNL